MIAGAMLTSRAIAGIELVEFVQLARAQLLLIDFTSGLLKAACFGAVIGIMSCHFGLRASGGRAPIRQLGRVVLDGFAWVAATVELTLRIFLDFAINLILFPLSQRGG